MKQIQERKRLRSIRCPACMRGKLLTTREKYSYIHTYLPTNHEQAKHFIKCPICKKQIGFAVEI